MNELTMNLNTKLNIPLYEQIYQYIKKEICTGELVHGEKLPSTRALSKYLEVSRSTVELAYEQLFSEGYIESIPCKGYFVAQLDGLYYHEVQKETETTKKIDEKKFQYNFTPYGIDLKSFPYNVWRKVSKEVLLNEDADLFNSGDSKGEVELRMAIKQYLHQARGVKCNVDQIVLGAGNEYLLLLLGIILGTKHKIAFENPTYKQAYRVFESQGFDVVSVNMDRYGMSIHELEKTSANLAYVMPSHQYPLGIVMPVKRRMELLKWAQAVKGRYIIEDDYDSEFRYKGKPIPALQGNDRNGKVIYLGTFSRSIAPAIRVSYMVLPEELLEVYQEKCMFMSCTVPKVDQHIVSRFMEQGRFERHLNRMRAQYKSRRDTLLTHLKPLLSKCTIRGEHAGVHVLLTFHDGRSEKDLIESAAMHDIKVYGLSGYDMENGRCEQATILLGYANMKEEDIIEATKILCEIWK